ncbi:hypothetical protein PF008_g9893 [Phytophthora fragariae]|uniref:Uncharacterized protein n=1 Tax=Phytophthora fragariae TaxID=53985 RepID=A0A6G0RVF9_9STRA|nr:hypothetical protein PF008_g9893 [Phytophthora fragariae]
MGRAPENATVLIEGLPELDPLLKVARSLCSVQEGQTIVEICNTSYEDLVIRKDTALAAATVVPDSAFSTASPVGTSSAVSTHSDPRESQAHHDLNAVIGATVVNKDPPKNPMPGLDEAYQAELEATSLTRSSVGNSKDSSVPCWATFATGLSSRPLNSDVPTCWSSLSTPERTRRSNSGRTACPTRKET